MENLCSKTPESHTPVVSNLFRLVAAMNPRHGNFRCWFLKFILDYPYRRLDLWRYMRGGQTMIGINWEEGTGQDNLTFIISKYIVTVFNPFTVMDK